MSVLPRGFKTAAVAAGIKKSGLDLGLLYSEQPAAAAAVFTKNAFPAAPVIVSRQHMMDSGGVLRAVLVNAGNANAATGAAGLAAARSSAEQVAGRLGCKTEEVFVASTGVIGRPLPVHRISKAIPELATRLQDGDPEGFARAIMTTDTFAKIAARESAGVRIVGFAKGAGMIHPDMATMLAFVITDAKADSAVLDRALRYAVDRSFHAVTVDGDTSTNDVVLVLANGASGIALEESAFRDLLLDVCVDLAKAIARDGEGATKFVEFNIEGAPSDEAARHIGRTIARSPLVKTAIYGCDPNWGRVLAAIGNAGVPLSSSDIGLYIDDISLIGGDLTAAAEKMKSKEIRFRVSLNSGAGRARVWTCDLTEGYIRINADYTS